MPMCTPRLLAPSFKSSSRVAEFTIMGEKDKIESRILKINDYTDTRYLALYDFVLHFVASANLGL